MNGLKKNTFFVTTGLVLLLVSQLLLASPETLQQQKNKVKIAVMGQGDFHPDRTVQGNIRTLPDGLAARLIEQLSGTKRFDIVERSALRHVIREQQFGADTKESDLDKVIEETVDNLADVNGWTIAAASSAADHNDRLKEFKNLGTAVGADYIVYAVLEKQTGSLKKTVVPFSDSHRVVIKNQVDARLRLRVIATVTGRIIGADSLRTKISETAFTGKEPTQDEYSMFDHLGQQAAVSVLDMIFPAQIISADPWVVNRGSNEQVTVGDFYTVSREGKDIKDASGISIGKLRKNVGLAKVSQVQKTFSVLSVVEGDFKVDDLAIAQKKESSLVSGKTAPSLHRGSNIEGKSAQRPRLAVGLVKAHSTASTGIDANLHIPAFTDTLISRLAQTKRFQLIDRQETDQLINEQLAQAMAENRDMVSAMGQLKGADYIAIGSVASFTIEERTARLPGSSRTFVSQAGHIDGNMRIVDARTGDIMESRKISVSQSVEKTGSDTRIISELADTFADQVTVNLMNAIYPIKVAAIVSGVAYINRGTDGGLSVGEKLRAVRPGEAIIDPDTGVQLGVAEAELGTVELTEVEDARSKVAVNGIALLTGDILKRQERSKGRLSQQGLASIAPQRTGGDATKNDGKVLTLAVGKIKINPRGNNQQLVGINDARITNDLMIKLSQFPEFDIMERKEIDQILDEKAFTSIAAGSAPDSTLTELKGADYLIHAAIDDFLIRTERKEVPYTNEIQIRYFGTVEAGVRLIDVHSGRLTSAIKVRVNERIKKVDSHALAVNDLLDLLTTEIATQISDDLSARQKGELVPIGRREKQAESKPAPAVRRPNF
ncbi:MAG: hypothetical protein AXW15_14055 [Neptuniibacter sp. Phe_28]|nr:MAG: hypothetical protein AXW15_14055 [Neptuniibacter sp. Phe_28]